MIFLTCESKRLSALAHIELLSDLVGTISGLWIGASFCSPGEGGVCVCVGVVYISPSFSLSITARTQQEAPGSLLLFFPAILDIQEKKKEKNCK